MFVHFYLLSANGIFTAKIKYPDDIHKLSPQDIDQRKAIFSARCGIPKWTVGYMGNLRGCVMLVFQLPLWWQNDEPGDHKDIDVLGRIKDDISKRADWLKNSGIIGIQIAKEEYVDLTIGISGIQIAEEEYADLPTTSATGKFT